MPAKDQTRHSRVAELRSVSGSRHEFVDRENRIILEYRARSCYPIEYLGKASEVGENVFRFRVMNGFGELMAGQTVWVTASGPYLADPPSSPLARAAERVKITTDSQGGFLVALYGYNLLEDGPVPVTIRAGNCEQTFTLAGVSEVVNLMLEKSAPDPDVTGKSIVTLTVTAANGAPEPDKEVTWSWQGENDVDKEKTGTTDNEGKATLELTNWDSTPRTITVTVTVKAGDKSDTIDVKFVLPPVDKVELDNGTPNPAVNGSSLLTATVTGKEMPLSGKDVTWYWKVKDAIGDFQAILETNTITNDSGETQYMFSNDQGHRTITVKAEAEGVFSDEVDIQFGIGLPDWVLAIAERSMHWADANAYCTAQGGSILSAGSDNKNPKLPDGFALPSSAPNGEYWTSTLYPGYTDCYNTFNVVGGRFTSWAYNFITTETKDFGYVICVP
jgi:hypothetical protein